MRVLNKPIDPEHYQSFRDLLEKSCGIVLGENKQYLVTSRLGQLMNREGMRDLGQLLQRVQRPTESGLRGEVIQAMTTNETSWFRDGHPFTVLQEELFQKLAEHAGPRIRVWSAACASGQEPYSISMVLDEFRARGGALEAEIVGTDIAPAMVEQARQGIYTPAAIRRGLSPERLERYFRKTGDGNWQLVPQVRNRVRVLVHNLLDSYSPLGRFDLVFCRNVLIYFSAASREDILRRICRQLNPGGYLIVGASESLSRHQDDLEMIRTRGCVIYRRR